jgi:hypothetical protein
MEVGGQLHAMEKASVSNWNPHIKYNHCYVVESHRWSRYLLQMAKAAYWQLMVETSAFVYDISST